MKERRRIEERRRNSGARGQYRGADEGSPRERHDFPRGRKWQARRYIVRFHVLSFLSFAIVGTRHTQRLGSFHLSFSAPSLLTPRSRR